MKLKSKSKPKVEIRKVLNADGMVNLLVEEFGKIKDHRKNKPKISLSDCLMSGYAIFSLKFPSLLAFDERDDKGRNLEKMYRINKTPSDTHMREVLDEIIPDEIYPIFGKLFSELQRGKDLLTFRFLEDYYLISGDGTGYFSSDKVHCENCLEKKNKKTGNPNKRLTTQGSPFLTDWENAKGRILHTKFSKVHSSQKCTI